MLTDNCYFLFILYALSMHLNNLFVIWQQHYNYEVITAIHVWFTRTFILFEIYYLWLFTIYISCHDHV